MLAFFLFFFWGGTGALRRDQITVKRHLWTSSCRLAARKSQGRVWIAYWIGERYQIDPQSGSSFMFEGGESCIFVGIMARREALFWRASCFFYHRGTDNYSVLCCTGRHSGCCLYYGDTSPWYTTLVFEQHPHWRTARAPQICGERIQLR